MLYEGKSKAVFATSDPSRVIVHFKDDATAFNGVKHASVDGKGRLNCLISAHLFDRCAEEGIEHHMIERPVGYDSGQSTDHCSTAESFRRFCD